MEVDSSARFSYSKLDTYKECPRRYRYRYVDKIKKPRRTAETLLGECVHGALEELYRQLQHGRTMPLDEVLGVFDSLWKEGCAGPVEIHDKSLALGHFQKVGREDCLQAYYSAHAPFADNRSHEVEKKLGVGLKVDVDGEELECRIEGFIDRLSFPRDAPGAVEIHDYKTGAHLPTQEVVDGMFQFDVYDFLVRGQFPDTKEVAVFLHFLRFGRALRPSRGPAADRTALTKGTLSSLIQAVRRDHAWEPRRSALCDWCEYRDICPLWAHAEAVKALSADERREDAGVRLVDGLAALEDKKKALKDDLKRLEREGEKLEGALLAFAGDRMDSAGEKALVVSGTDAEAVITEKEEFRLPTKTHSPDEHEELEGALKETPIWKEVSHVDSHLLLEGFRRRRWAPDILASIELLLQRLARVVREKHLRLRRKRGEEEGS